MGNIHDRRAPYMGIHSRSKGKTQKKRRSKTMPRLKTRRTLMPSGQKKEEEKAYRDTATTTQSMHAELECYKKQRTDCKMQSGTNNNRGTKATQPLQKKTQTQKMEEMEMEDHHQIQTCPRTLTKIQTMTLQTKNTTLKHALTSGLTRMR